MLGTVGRVLPATEVPVVLKAQTAAGELLEGQVRDQRGGRHRDGLARAARRRAAAGRARGDRRGGPGRDRPGSLFTSVLAACAFPAIREAIARGSRRQRVYVANLREQLPETAGYDVARPRRGAA